MKISGAIITLNEEKHIAACIASLKQVCDDIVVVDSYSTDKTVELARQAGADVHLQAFLGDGPQKQLASNLTKHDWVLVLDADERLSEDASQFIQAEDLHNTAYDHYALRRKNYVGSHWIKAAGFYPDTVARLFNKTTAGYLPNKRHSYVTGKQCKTLKVHLSHYTYNNYAHWIQRINELSSNDAKFMYQDGIKSSRYTPVGHALAAFLRKYIFKGGIFQGMDGFTITLTTVMFTYFKYLKLNEYYENEKKSGTD